jgi:hypothetical protein
MKAASQVLSIFFERLAQASVGRGTAVSFADDRQPSIQVR